MTALEEIKKALKKVYIAEWYISGVKTNGLSVVHNAADSSMFGITAETFEAEYIAAVNPAAISELLSTLESLQRENEELRQRLDIGPCGENAIDVAESAADHFRHRAEASESEVKRLREALSIISAGHGCPMAVADNALRTPALASTGGEHHAE